MQRFNKENLDKTPNASGVYLLYNKQKQIVYIGRASSLKKRLASYIALTNENNKKKIAESRPIVDMILEVQYFNYKQTTTLLEAIILEANLIKKHWPKYNVREKDDRSFVYLIIPKKSEFPAPIIVRQREVEKYTPIAHIFGPYQSFGILKTALGLVRKIFPFSTCRPNSGKPCFHYQIGLCPGVCLGKVSSSDYKKNINHLILFFKGENKKLLTQLKKENPTKALALKQIEDVSLISKGLTNENVAFNRIEAYDISHFGGKNSYGAMVVFVNHEANTDEYRLFKIKSATAGDDTGALKEILSRRLLHREWIYPQLIVVDGGRGQVNAMNSVLKSNNLAIPVIGLSKIGGHSASAYSKDVLVFNKMKKSLKDLITLSLPIIQKARDEAHRFCKKNQIPKTKYQNYK